MTDEELNALFVELTGVSALLKDVVSRVVEQQTEFKALLEILDQKGVVTPVELDRAGMEIIDSPTTALPSRLGRCRRNAARGRDRF